MALPNALKKQAEKVDGYYKNTGDDQTDPSTQTSQSAPTEIPKPQSQTSETHDDIDYKAKYKTLEGKYKAEVPKLHDEVSQLKSKLQQLSAIETDNSKVSQLESQIRELQQANSQLMQTIESGKNGANEQLNSYLSDEYGEEFAKAVAEQARAIANAESSRLTQELEAIKNQFQQTQETVTQSSEQAALNSLSSMLQAQGINFNEVDGDPLFHNWLNQVDTRSGETYSNLMRKAFAQGDLKRTASFYVDYNASQPRSNRQLNEYADPLNTVNQSDTGSNNAPFDPNAFKRLGEQLMRKQITREEYEQKERELFRALNRQ
jgi:hypothetical protein